MRLIYSLLLFFSFFSSVCQNEFKKWSIGMWGGITQYNGDRGQEFFSSSQATYGFAGLSLSRYVSKHFQLSAAFTSGQVGNIERVEPWSPRGDKHAFKVQVNSYNLNFQYNITKPGSLLIPYVYLGAGILQFPKKYTNSTNRSEYALPNIGAGLSIRLNEFMSLKLQENFTYTSADDLDFEVNELNDSYLFHSIGISFNLGKSRDSDRDGISDASDECPNSARGLRVDRHGCPYDKDDDGIPDYLDYCPQQAGVAAFHGCPDKDNDGVSDKYDPCPEAAGPFGLKGCPDEDGDGIKDDDDKCAGTKKGYSVNNTGCPLDNDEDGVVNEEDHCPNLEGEMYGHGCPDFDGDSIPDIHDICPHEKGTKQNKGCAAISGEDAKKLEQIASKIYFENNSAKLKAASFVQLDALVPILKKYNAVNLVIEGHADDSKDKTVNQDLAVKRSEAVRQYLVEKGIFQGRLTCISYGDEKPQSGNENLYGHGKNRRVELKTIY
jgi:outer membrane protein OmpA-like peptidoglycan-associated protein